MQILFLCRLRSFFEDFLVDSRNITTFATEIRKESNFYALLPLELAPRKKRALHTSEEYALSADFFHRMCEAVQGLRGIWQGLRFSYKG